MKLRSEILLALADGNELTARQIIEQVGAQRMTRPPNWMGRFLLMLSPDGALRELFAQPFTGSVYPILIRLEQEGRITSRWLDEKEPRRRVYRLPLEQE